MTKASEQRSLAVAYMKSRKKKNSYTQGSRRSYFFGHPDNKPGNTTQSGYIDDDSNENPAASISNGITVTNGSWNVRTGPGSNYESVGTVRKGAVLQKVNIGDWLPVVYNGEVRYISPKAVK